MIPWSARLAADSTGAADPARSAKRRTAGPDLDRSTLADWVGQAVRLLDPIVAGIRAHIFAADKIHGDDTPVPVLAPGTGKTKTGRLWGYATMDEETLRFQFLVREQCGLLFDLPGPGYE